MTDRKMIDFDRPKLDRLKKDYDKAKASGAEQFTFDGEVYLVSYAKYVIEYLESQFKR